MGLWTRVRLPPIPLKELSSEAFQKDMKVQKKIPGYRRVSFFIQVDAAFLQAFQHASRDNTHPVFYLPSFITSSMLRYTGCVNSSFN